MLRVIARIALATAVAGACSVFPEEVKPPDASTGGFGGTAGTGVGAVAGDAGSGATGAGGTGSGGTGPTTGGSAGEPGSGGSGGTQDASAGASAGGASGGGGEAAAHAGGAAGAGGRADAGAGGRGGGGAAGASGGTGGSSDAAPDGPIKPVNGILDDFNRADGPIGNGWVGTLVDKYQIMAKRLLPMQTSNSYGPVCWPTQFGAEQEAFVTLYSIEPTTFDMGVCLKKQSGNDYIAVVFSTLPNNKHLEIYTQQTNVGATYYAQVPNLWPQAGDVLHARAHASGLVEVFLNGVLVLTDTVSGYQPNASPGRICLFERDSYIQTIPSVFDDFGGGSLP